MTLLVAAFAGLLFGTGLTISGMVNPAVVLGFLDLTGNWNPALLFVMIGALAVAVPGYQLLKGRRPFLAETQSIPSRSDIDVPLLLGAAIFGVGWGLAGICPGPALTMLAIKPTSASLFIISMSAGMLGALWVGRSISGSAK
ncbi:MAG: YeeE/YedE family protein [Hyphomicrobiaceae bacterium]|nr:YeeE/YedE family protein [Hyphomicrobiaceae bacterium]